MIKAQLKREDHAVTNRIDGKFLKGSFKKEPMIGEAFVFYMGRLDDGWWTTTPVTEILKTGRTVIFRTQNSKYVLKKGWGE